MGLEPWNDKKEHEAFRMQPLWESASGFNKSQGLEESSGRPVSGGDLTGATVSELGGEGSWIQNSEEGHPVCLCQCLGRGAMSLNLGVWKNLAFEMKK